MREPLKAVIIDVATGEIDERDFTAEEIAVHELTQTEFLAVIAEQEAKTIARVSACEKLAELGLTAEEIASL
jgi:hypothetical protein